MDIKEKDDDQEEKVFTKIEHDGVIKDLQKERTDRQNAQFDLEQSRRELESLKKTVADAKVKSDEKVELTSEKIKFEGKDDDYATVKDVKLGFKSLEKDSEAKFKAAQKTAKAVAEQEIAQENYDSSLRLADEKYSKLASIGLDFKTVYQAAIKRIGRNKYEEAAIFYSKNPGERLYKIGCENPEIKIKLDLEENQELLKSMETRKVDKTSLTGGTKVKSDEFFTPQEIIDMKPSKAKDHLDKIDKSMKHWEELRKQKK